MTFRPLAGIRVLDFTQAPPGGYCTVQLVDLGAEVVRVESPAQAGRPSLVIGQMGLSRGKRSLTLDMRAPAAADVLRRLVRGFDVVVENAKPGSMAARGFGYPHAAAENPGVIWCAITGYGQDGPYAAYAGHDLSYLGQSGLLAALSPELPWHPAAMLSVPLGAMQATSAILAALVARGASGRGCEIDISLAEAATWLLTGMSSALKEGFVGIAATPDRRLYRCSDGRFVSVAAAEPRTWAALCTGLDLPELADKLGVRGGEAAAVAERLAAVFATRPAAEWVERLGAAGAAVNPVNAGADIGADPHVGARGGIVTVAGEPVPANPIRMRTADGETSATETRAPGSIGADTDAVLTQAGFAADEIAALRRDALI